MFYYLFFKVDMLLINHNCFNLQMFKQFLVK